MPGLNRSDGQPISGWEEVAQAIRTILTTPIGTRVMRRDFGSWVPQLIDAPATQENLTRVFVAVASAVDLWEPRFILRRVTVAEIAPGLATLDLEGLHIPDGHLRNARAATIRVTIGGVS